MFTTALTGSFLSKKEGLPGAFNIIACPGGEELLAALLQGGKRLRDESLATVLA